MATAKQVIQSVLAGGVAERTLFAPLLCVAACAVADLSPREFLNHSTKLTNTLRDLQQGLALDIVVPESGSHLVAEALGADLDWSVFPPALDWSSKEINLANLEDAGRLPFLLDVIGRLNYLLRDQAAIGILLDGPQRISALSKGQLSLDEAAQIVLTITKRILSTGGVDLIWFREEGPPPTDGKEWMEVTDPIWGTVRFFKALPALHLAGEADGWLEIIEEAGPSLLPCFDPVRSPTLADRLHRWENFGVIVPLSRLTSDMEEEVKKTYRDCMKAKGCALITNDADWFGQVAPQELKKRAEWIRNLLL